MAAYATYEDIEKGYRPLEPDEREKATELLRRAALIIDAAAAAGVSDDVKNLVSCNMVTRALTPADACIPVGVTQGTQSGLGYAQSYTFGAGSSGELYLSKTDKKLLKCGNRIGAYSPVEEL